MNYAIMMGICVLIGGLSAHYTQSRMQALLIGQILSAIIVFLFWWLGYVN